MFALAEVWDVVHVALEKPLHLPLSRVAKKTNFTHQFPAAVPGDPMMNVAAAAAASGALAVVVVVVAPPPGAPPAPPFSSAISTNPT